MKQLTIKQLNALSYEELRDLRDELLYKDKTDNEHVYFMKIEKVRGKRLGIL